jgi:hypothetical protein
VSLLTTASGPSHHHRVRSCVLVFWENMTRLCQRPIVHNRTRPVIPGAYWTVTGRCLHRVRSCDHRIQSSCEKRISPFLTVRSDLAFFLFLLDPQPFRAPPPHRVAASPPSPRPARHRSRVATAAIQRTTRADPRTTVPERPLPRLRPARAPPLRGPCPLP